MAAFERIPSGLPGLDEAIDNIRLGDNVVWQVSSMEDYLFFVKPFFAQAVKDGRNMIYMHFTGHPVLIHEQEGVQRFDFDPKWGFETFTLAVRRRITEEGKDAFYVFDSLSELQVAWATDLMMGNFFQVTCPYLFEMDTVAYFPIHRGRHSYDAIARIRETTQLLFDVYQDKEHLYLNPLKVWNRYSPSMFLPHQYLKDGSFPSIKDGFEMSQFYNLIDKYAVTAPNQSLDSWERFIAWAKQKYYENGVFSSETKEAFSRNMMSGDEKVLKLLERYFSAEDYFQIQSRMIGTGGIGGKACGMLLARKIVALEAPEAFQFMEAHDSFYVGSDVFYTFIVHNHFWKLRIHQKTKEGYFSAAKSMQEAFQNGRFPEGIRMQFAHMLEYFGQCPLIVRSSSLQEDGFGNAFAGKYESVFCINSGDLDQRISELENAVRIVYASTMDVSALEYRRQRGLEDVDEQMAVLIQRVSGTMYEDFLMPSAAGVGYSYSSYRWSDDMDPNAGMLRLVMGLGTRAVDRTEGDYPRLVSLDNPKSTVLTNSQERHRFSQNYVDMMDYQKRSLATRSVDQVLKQLPDWYKKLVLEHDYETETMFRERGQRREVLFASCQGLVNNQNFTDCMKLVLCELQKAYNYPVDIEFTVNGNKDGAFVFNLLQCRPLQLGTNREQIVVPNFTDEQLIFHVTDSSMGGSRKEKIDHIVYIDSKAYYEYPYKDKSKIARVIGDLNRWFNKENPQSTVMLFVPGRIGTSSPELGVPVAFADIHNFSAVCEVSDSRAGYMPELSYGSHMFQDLVESEIFYTAIFESEKSIFFDRELLETGKNLLPEILPQYEELAHIVFVHDLSDQDVTLYSDMQNRETVLAKT